MLKVPYYIFFFQDTVYGNCSTHVTVNARKGSVATEISTERNLQQCDGFQPVNTGVSPLALIKGLVSLIPHYHAY
jgi:apolipoprotein B